MFSEGFTNSKVEPIFSSGDKILEVNGEKLHGLTHNEAIAKFKKVKSGNIDLLVRSRTPSPYPR